MAIRTATPTHLSRDRELEEERAVIDREHRISVADRVIWFIAGVILTLLAFRFVLALFGANPANAFADFIYTTSHPFVAPFFTLFNYNFDDGVGRFELYTLIAMAVYAVIAAGLSRLATIPSRRV
jgi:hypothetical protein